MGKSIEQTFRQRRHFIYYMASKYMKRCPVLLVIGEIQIKTTINSTSYPLEWLYQKKAIQALVMMWSIHTLLVGMLNDRAILENNSAVLKSETQKEP